RHLHLDHLVEVGRVAPRLFGTIAERREQLLRVKLHSFSRRADEPVARPAGVLRHLRPARADIDRDRFLRAVVDGRVARVVVVAVEGHRLLGPQQAYEAYGFAQPGKALLVVGPWNAQGALVEVL